MTWHLNELRELVKRRHGDSVATALNPSLNAVALKIAFAKYHADETLANINELLSGTSQDEPTELVKLIFEQATDSDRGKKFRKAQFKAEANIIAFAQSLHSVADIFSQIIFFSLNLQNFSGLKLPKNRLYLGSMVKELERIGQCNSLTSSLNKLLDSDEFDYLNAFVNTTKHISLINSRYTLSFVEEAELCHGMRISEFKYKTKHYVKKWSDKFLGDDFKFLNTAIVESGVILNNCLE